MRTWFIQGFLTVQGHTCPLFAKSQINNPGSFNLPTLSVPKYQDQRSIGGWNFCLNTRKWGGAKNHKRSNFGKWEIQTSGLHKQRLLIINLNGFDCLLFTLENIRRYCDATTSEVLYCFSHTVLHLLNVVPILKQQQLEFWLPLLRAPPSWTTTKVWEH